MAAHDHGVPIPMEAARIAAEAGYVPGMTVYGIGLANDGQIDAGTVWLDRADQAGDVMATVALGTLHMDHGRLTLADQYFTLAAMRGHQGAAAALAELRSRPRPPGSAARQGTGEVPGPGGAEGPGGAAGGSGEAAVPGGSAGTAAASAVRALVVRALVVQAQAMALQDRAVRGRRVRAAGRRAPPGRRRGSRARRRRIMPHGC